MAASDQELHRINYSDISSSMQKLGEGSYGIVYRAKWNNRDVAVKEFFSDNLDAIQREIHQLHRVEKHPNIIELLGVCERREDLIYVVLEYAECGSLDDFLHGSTKYAYTGSHAMSWLYQCAQGVAYLHGMQPKPVLHRDLKPGNLLLSNHYRTVKIADFGTVADLKTLMTSRTGSPLWMAPEVFKGSKYTEKCDVYSWGIILWEVITRERPYKEFSNFIDLLDAVIKGTRPPLIRGCPPLLNKLMTDCWDDEPLNRPSMQEILIRIKEIFNFFPDAEKPIEYASEDHNEQMSETVLENIQKTLKAIE